MNEKDTRKFNKALELIRNNDNEEALYILKRLYNKYENNISILFQLGMIEKKLNNYTAAKKHLSKVFSMQHDKHILLELGKIEAFLGNYETAISFFEERLSIEPNNIYVATELVKSYMGLGNMEVAEKILRNIINVNNNVDYYGLLYFLLLNILIIKKDYEGALDIIYQKGSYINNFDVLKEKLFYIKYKMGILTENEKPKSYFEKQLVNYNYKKAISHISSHLTECEEKEIHSLFSPSIRIEDLYHEVVRKLNDTEIIYFSTCDKYVVDMGYIIGQNRGKETSNVMVVTIHETHKIIAMYPYINDYNVRKKDQKRKKLFVS